MMWQEAQFRQMLYQKAEQFRQSGRRTRLAMRTYLFCLIDNASPMLHDIDAVTSFAKTLVEEFCDDRQVERQAG